MKTKAFLQLFTALLFSTILGLFVASATGFNPMATVIVCMALTFIPKGLEVGSFSVGGLEVEIWHNWIVEQLFKNNEFLNFCRKADDYVLNGKVVHIPQSGQASAVKKNRTELPGTITKRTDTDAYYMLNEFTSDPRLIQAIEQIQLSYDKMSSVMGQDMRWLQQVVAEDMLYQWAQGIASANVLKTTGSSVASHLSGTSGTYRKGVKIDDLDSLQAVMTEANVPEDNRHILLDARMYQQLTSELKATTYRDFSSSFDRATGKIVGKLFGFEVHSRSTALRANVSGVIADPAEFTAASTDNAIALAWHADWVERAMGTVKVFERRDDPTYYGDIFSMLVNAGGRRVSKDDLGVLLLTQDAI